MIQLMLYILMLILSTIFMQMDHPLAMGLMLLIQTMMAYSLMTGLMTKTFWFSYILFLVLLGSMFVLFIYTTSLASNQMFSFSMKLIIILTIMMILKTSTLLITDKTSIMCFLSNNNINSNTNYSTYTNENSITLNKLYNYPTNMIARLLMNYLLITLIAVVKITKLFQGPLRMMN